MNGECATHLHEFVKAHTTSPLILTVSISLLLIDIVVLVCLDSAQHRWLMKEAKKRNPDIKLYGLPWAFAGWLDPSAGPDKRATNAFANVNVSANYTVSWLEGAKNVHGLSIDYIGQVRTCCHACGLGGSFVCTDVVVVVKGTLTLILMLSFIHSLFTLIHIRIRTRQWNERDAPPPYAEALRAAVSQKSPETFVYVICP